MQSIVFDQSSLLAKKMMELSMERQKVIANNLANANTPGYTRRELEFGDQLADAVRGGRTSDIAAVGGKMVEDNSGEYRLDGNNVSVANEMNHMMQNNVFYNLMAKAFSTRMGIIKAAIR